MEVDKTYLRFLKKKIEDHILLSRNNFKKINYDFYPHHIWSSLTRYEKFKKLDLEDVKKFQIVFEAYCHNYDEQYSFNVTKKIKDVFVYEIY